ncbi:MAG: hypothetical protein KDB07_03425, partial [Planctomycetes bacterium]|nr:hypothetical protein [Planctomycetota bacterium]
MPVYAITLEHREGTNSPHSHEASANLRASGVDLGEVDATTTYLLEGDFDGGVARDAAQLLADSVLESAIITVNEIPAKGEGTQLLIMRREGVMDPAEASILATLSNAKISPKFVKRAHLYRFGKDLSSDEQARAYAVLGNDAIEECHRGALKLDTLSHAKAYV